MVGEQAGPMFSCNLARGTRAFILVVLSACLLASCRADNDELSSIAVLPLENASSDPSDSDYLADGITQSVIMRLAQVGLRLTPWESVRRFKGSKVEPRDVARELNVDAVLLGTFQIAEERILTRLTLVEADSGIIVWAEEFEESYQDLFRMQRRIAEGAATSLKRSLSGEEEKALATPESTSVEAYDLYMQASYLLHQEGRESTAVSLDYFTRAVELDPELVEAHVGIGAVYGTRYHFGWGSGPSSLERAASSYRRALALDPGSMSARRGLLLLSFFKGESEAVLEQGRLAAQSGRADDVETLLTRAQSLHYGGFTELSLEPYRRVIQNSD